jgi:hypothetical protein
VDTQYCKKTLIQCCLPNGVGECVDIKNNLFVDEPSYSKVICPIAPTPPKSPFSPRAKSPSVPMAAKPEEQSTEQIAYGIKETSPINMGFRPISPYSQNSNSNEGVSQNSNSNGGDDPWRIDTAARVEQPRRNNVVMRPAGNANWVPVAHLPMRGGN